MGMVCHFDVKHSEDRSRPSSQNRPSYQVHRQSHTRKKTYLLHITIHKETEPSNINQGNAYSVNQGQKSSTIFYTTHQNHRRFGWKKV
jgi:hypothetical protein